MCLNFKYIRLVTNIMSYTLSKKSDLYTLHYLQTKCMRMFCLYYTKNCSLKIQ